MLSIKILCIGRLRDEEPEAALTELYRRRCRWPIEINELLVKRRLEKKALMRAEAALLLATRPQGTPLVALDERGRDFSSRDLAAHMGKWRDSGVPVVAFAIGGPYGHDQSLRDKSSLILSMGRLTWPHKLSRAMLMEQIYRCECILSGHPITMINRSLLLLVVFFCL